MEEDSFLPICFEYLEIGSKMWISFSILLLSVQYSVAERDMTPVFVLDFDRVLTELPSEASAFMKLNSSDFSVIIDQAIKRTKVVILFVEESFCSEDISSKDTRGTPFYHLEQALRERKVKYLPSVSQAFKTLKSHLQPLPSYVFYLSDSSSKMRIYDKKLRHFYIYFNDRADETRVSALRRHDLLIKEVYFVVRQVASGPVVAFYTGKLNPVAVTPLTFRHAKLDKPSSRPGVTIFSDGALFRFIGVYAQTGTRRSTFSQIPLIAKESWGERGLTTRMAYTDFELEFSFGFKEDRWTIENVALLEWGEEVGRTDMRVGAPWNYSFVCSEPLVLVNMRDGSAVTISHYQIQPFKTNKILNRRDESEGGEGTEEGKDSEGDKETDGGKETWGNASKTHTFGPAVNCGPYFNAQILAGLMVTTLCLAILTYGVVSLYNVTANSKYDDPQAKPLLIVPEGGGH